MSRNQFDQPWKKIITSFLPELMEFFYPQFYAEIDWSKPYQSIEQEIFKSAPESYIGKGMVDKLFKVHLKNQKTQYVSIHLEIQGEDRQFPKRIGKYKLGLLNQLGPKVFSVAILIDTDAAWRPTSYRWEFWGCYVEVGYQTIKLLDYVDRLNELEASSNPFALVVLVHVLALKKGNLNQRLAIKKQLGRLLISKRFDRKYTLRLLEFLDWLFYLPKTYEQSYHNSIETYDQENKTMFVPAYMQERVEQALQEGEAKGEAKGKAEGKHDGEALALMAALKTKFGELPSEAVDKIMQADEQKMLHWITQIFTAQSLNELLNS